MSSVESFCMGFLSLNPRGNLGTLPDVRDLLSRCFSGQPSELGGPREGPTQKHFPVTCWTELVALSSTGLWARTFLGKKEVGMRRGEEKKGERERTICKGFGESLANPRGMFSEHLYFCGGDSSGWSTSPWLLQGNILYKGAPGGQIDYPSL